MPVALAYGKPLGAARLGGTHLVADLVSGGQPPRVAESVARTGPLAWAIAVTGSLSWTVTLTERLSCAAAVQLPDPIGIATPFGVGPAIRIPGALCSAFRGAIRRAIRVGQPVAIT